MGWDELLVFISLCIHMNKSLCTLGLEKTGPKTLSRQKIAGIYQKCEVHLQKKGKMQTLNTFNQCMYYMFIRRNDKCKTKSCNVFWLLQTGLLQQGATVACIADITCLHSRTVYIQGNTVEKLNYCNTFHYQAWVWFPHKWIWNYWFSKIHPWRSRHLHHNSPKQQSQHNLSKPA